MVQEAHALAQTLYGSCSCYRGQSCIRYVEEVARLLLPSHPDAHTLCACFLQCVHSPENLQIVEEKFGKSIRSSIAAIAILDGQYGEVPKRSMEKLRRMVLALANDVRVLLIAIHNNIYLLHHPQYIDAKNLNVIAREVLKVYAPICARLGMYALKYKMETRSFSVLYPEDSKELFGTIESLQKNHESSLQKVEKEISTVFKKERLNATISTRIKHPYSIFRKMNRKNITQPSDLYDLFGMRILVRSEADCYKALGVIHRNYQPLPHRMKDYIAMPKLNGYCSLHTTIIGTSSLPIEIQIRTNDMDKEAEYGIAAHWNYKEHGSSVQAIFGERWQERLKKLSNLSLVESEEDEISDRIFVLTPKGDVVELSKGAIPLDFAFRVHTDVGLRYRHAIVNGAITAINHTLENGDVVDVQTWSLPRPSEQWIYIAKTKHTRHKLRAHFRSIGEMEQRGSEEKKRVPQKQQNIPTTSPRASAPTVTLSSETALPYQFAKCCHPEAHALKHPPIIGCVTREGVVRIHWTGCRMITGANPERLIRASWKVASPLSSGA